MIEFSQRTNFLKDSPTLKLNERINVLKNQGKDIINLTVGEPNYYEPEISREAAIQAIKNHFTHYTNSSGIISLRENICKKLKLENGLNYRPEQITVSAGGKQALFNSLSVLINHGDEVIIPTPAWPTYEEQVRLVGGTPHLVSLNEKTSFKLTPELLEKNINSNTKVLILNSPSNPTGATYSIDELKELVSIIEKNRIIVISDEIYERLVYDLDFVSPASLSQYMYENTITINGFSKSFGMTGWRIGYSAAPEEIAHKIAAFQSQITASISSVSQVAAEQAILNFDYSHVNDLVRNREYLVDIIRRGTKLSLPTVPDGSFYLFPNLSEVLGKEFFGKKVTTAEDFCELLLSKVGVAVTPGSFFNAPNNIRISYAKSFDEIQEAGRRIVEFFN